MMRLTDMALPEGSEYPELKPRERQMAGRLLLRFCALRRSSNLWISGFGGRVTVTSIGRSVAAMTEHEPIRIAERKREDEEHEARMERRRARKRPSGRRCAVERDSLDSSRSSPSEARKLDDGVNRSVLPR